MEELSGTGRSSLTCHLCLQLVELCLLSLCILHSTGQLLPQVHLLLLVGSELQLQLGNLGCGSCQLLCNFGLEHKMEQGKGRRKNGMCEEAAELFSQEELEKGWRPYQDLIISTLRR